MRSVDALETLELLGSNQWGLVTSAQADAAGLNRVWLTRLTEHGTLQRVRHGVYALPSAGHGPLQDLRAAWLATEPKKSASERARSLDPVVASGQAAAAVHQLGDLVSTVYEFTSPTRRQSSQRDLRFRRRPLVPGDTEVVDGLPVTSVPRTVADLARDHADFDHLARVVRDALDKADLNAGSLAQALNPYADRFGAENGGDLLSRLAIGSSRTAKAVDLLRHLNFSLPESTVNQLQEATAKLISPYLSRLQEVTAKAVAPYLNQLNFDVPVPRETLDRLRVVVEEAAGQALNSQVQQMLTSPEHGLNGKVLTNGADHGRGRKTEGVAERSPKRSS